MQFPLTIEDSQQAMEFARYLSSFQGVDAWRIKVQTKADICCLHEIKDLLETQFQTSSFPSLIEVEVDARSLFSTMTEAEKEEAKREQEGVRQAMRLLIHNRTYLPNS